jgi:transcriptional regulator with XRE-family HTH domain
MLSQIASRIGATRKDAGLTQDQFGMRYSVSGPAVFKFEKGYVKPSLKLWLRMAKDCGLSEKKAVLLWIKEKLPQEYQAFVDVSAQSVADAATTLAVAETQQNYARLGDPHELRQRLHNDTSLPAGLRSLFEDNQIWALYRPTGQEIQKVIETFGDFAEAKESMFREAMRLIREFMRSQY